MILSYITITGSFSDGTGNPVASGTVTFTPSQPVYAAGQPLETPDLPIACSIVNGSLVAPGGGSVQLLAQGNSGLTMGTATGWWAWGVEIAYESGQVSDAWSFMLDNSPTSADLFATRGTPAVVPA